MIHTASAVSLDMLGQARKRALQTGCSVLTELENLTGLSSSDLLQEIGVLLHLPVVTIEEIEVFNPAFDLLPLSKAMQKYSVLLRSADDSIVGVIADPFDADLQIWMEAQAHAPVIYWLALQADIQAYLNKQEASVRTMDELFNSADQHTTSNKTAAVLSFTSVSEAISPIVRLVNSTLYDALKAGASDIHLESTANGLTIKYRVDGVLNHASTVNGVEVTEHVISRLKVLAELDIAERRIPQDGSFRVESNERDIDLRLSIMPSIHGEDAVIRVLDKRAMIEAYGSLTLEALGFDDDSLISLRALAEEAYGMLLVTGPTGSGKTTTLYAVLTEIHNGQDKIITIEDPVEYQLPGILQIPVNEKKGLTFAKGLRSILRHDPDKIMVGEIRDTETAEIAVQSALTGHLVLSTVHANNVFDVFGRFTHMGIDPYAFVSALNGIWAQRLVRLNCPFCTMKAYRPTEAELLRVHLTWAEVEGYSFKRSQGCGHCRGTGYKGRKAIAEILRLNDEIRELIIDKRPIRQIKEAARLNGTRTLREAALELVESGVTTLDEIKRVTLHA